MWIVFVGAFTGLVGGLFGKGGSAIATPLLTLGGVSSFAALASPLPATIPATVLAARAYWRAGEVDTDLVRTTITIGVPAAVVGALLSAVIGGGVLVATCDVVVAALGVRMLARQRVPVGQPSGTQIGAKRAFSGDITPIWAPLDVKTMRDTSPTVVVAAITGLVSGLLANSGGFLLAPLFVTALRMPIKRALGTSLAAAAVLAVPSTLVHAALGHVDWSVTIPFAAASVPLSAVGARIALRSDAGRLEMLYGIALVALGGGLLFAR